MSTRSLSLFLFLLLTYNFNECDCAEPKKKVNSSFVASDQWKKIEEGQTISPGLHVRINLKTGEKEAKLADTGDSDNNKKSLIVTTKEEETLGKTYDTNELKKILRHVKADDGVSDDRVKKKFRSYDELKKEFDKLKVQMKSDHEILVGLIENFKKFHIRTKFESNNSFEWTKDEDVISTLIDLEYLVHQIDNAHNFAKLNGFSEVIYKSLNSSNSEIRSEALKLLGSATQSNPAVQIAALQSGSINLLIKVLTFDENINVRSRSLYALSCLIRRFPIAQEKFISDGGLEAFSKIFDQEKQDLLKLQIRIITLLHDLLFEQRDTKMSVSNEENKHRTDKEMEGLKEKLRQYEKINLEQKLVEQDWCKRLSTWFYKQNQMKGTIENGNLNNSEEINVNFARDFISEVAETFYVLSDICKSEFKSDKDFVSLLFSLKEVYSELALDEAEVKDETNFYGSISNILKILLDKLVEKKMQKDEL